MTPPVLAVALALCRLGPVIWLVPPGRLTLPRLGLGAALVLLVAPALHPLAAGLAGTPPAALLPLLLREALCGAALGLCAAGPFFAAQAAGRLLPPAGPLYGWMAVALFFALRGPEVLIAAVARSYAWVPPGAGLPGHAIFYQLPARLFLSGAVLALPPALAGLGAQALLAALLGRRQVPALSALIGLLALAPATLLLLYGLHRAIAQLGTTLAGLR